jgi:hypothetical protein
MWGKEGLNPANQGLEINARDIYFPLLENDSSYTSGQILGLLLTKYQYRRILIWVKRGIKIYL